MRGRFERMSSEFELTMIQMESAEILAKKIEEEARRLAPRSPLPPADGSPRFADTLVGHAAPTGSGFAVTLSTSMGQLREWLLHGTAPHEIRAVNASALHFTVQGNEVFATVVQHPGTKPSDWESKLKAMVYPLAREEGGRIGARMVRGLAGRL